MQTSRLAILPPAITESSRSNGAPKGGSQSGRGSATLECGGTKPTPEANCPEKVEEAINPRRPKAAGGYAAGVTLDAQTDCR